MVYVDTSALVPVFIREPKSEAIVAWLETSRARLALSEWSLVEFASAASIKVRSGEIAASSARQAGARAKVFARRHCRVLIPSERDFLRAADLAGRPELKLRAGDALHLAIAITIQARELLCVDTNMVECAKMLGIGVVAV